MQFAARTFRLDVTPPIGDYVCGGLSGRSLGVETPLELRGVLLQADQPQPQRCAVVVVDYCYLCGRSYRRLAQAIARAAELSISDVSLHANHVHDAPLINEEVHATYADSIPGVHDERYFAQVIGRVEQAIAEARRNSPISLRHMSFSSAPVRQFASTRRILDENNRCAAVRWSVLTKVEDMHLKDAPEGKIDPDLDQITFYDSSGAARISMNFYASHPQVSSGRHVWSADTIGVARELFERANPGVFTLNFDGCGGDVTAGKYTSTNRHRNRLVFGVRLYDAMQAAFDSASIEPLNQLKWRRRSFDMPLRREEHDEHYFKAILQDEQADPARKYLAGLKFFKLHNQIVSYPFDISNMQVNEYNVLFMPAELFVEYQLYAKSIAPSKLTAAAYGDSFFNYVPTDEAFEQGGYEVLPEWTEVGSGCEARIKRAIDTILLQAE